MFFKGGKIYFNITNLIVEKLSSVLEFTANYIEADGQIYANIGCTT